MSDGDAPRATYRLQLNAGFTFDDAARIAPYLASLGVSHVYASPIQKARPGSSHCYDIVDHERINPELGGEDGLFRFSAALAASGLRLLLDIVPNHMGVGGADNAWWLSTLEWGEQSPYARMFDIDWDRAGANGKLVVPFLGKPYGEALRTGELQLRFDADEGSFSVWHWEHRFPINPLDYRWIFEWAQVAGGGGLDMRPLYEIAEELRELAEAPRPVTREGRVERCERIKRDIAFQAQSSAHVRAAIDTAVAFACGDPRTPQSFGALHRILERQSYRPAYWRVAAFETNYRRFFDINSLAGVRIEDEAVFEATHALIFRLVAEGHVHGLRIDHIDGLADPKTYLQRVRARVGSDVYVIVEKILEPGERLRGWPIAGTTGYDAMTQLDAIFVAHELEDAFTAHYEACAGVQPEFPTQLRNTKLELLRASFGSEMESLVRDLKHAAEADLVTSDFTADALRRALWEIIAALPVYRTYLDTDEPAHEDRVLIETAVAQAKSTTSLDTSAAHDLIETFLLSARDPQRSPSRQIQIDRIIRRFQQLTGPVMAKSLEDTLFYRYARFVGLNEVGGDPARFGLRIEDFHALNAVRAAAWPHSLVATATHDMKRGEDVRARLAALSHAPAAWSEIVQASE
ncbi:MAG: malto-oligosyltrehalose synthase, partial [Beijerinckiaceae bacterium]|nr:malto-oligosyltrehalose synthase [Beijerinckiaceae bacterium]